MTADRLKAAIAAHDEDGEGRARVIAAARRTLAGKPGGLECVRPSLCLLASAWQSSWVMWGCFLRDGKRHGHTYDDVIRWFDSFDTNRQACRLVIRLLGGEK